ncbi:MAG: glutamine synthetase family protein [Eubacterium sp.]|nr:glutamine synthetase family protein [Eubacterium sp.]
MHYSKDDIIRMVEEEDVDFIRLQFTDTFGNLKNMAVTSNQLELVLNNRCTFDGAAINGFDTENVDELILVPDLDTFAIFPWRPQRGRVARFICDVMNPDGSPFMADSRFILSQVAKEAKEMGYTFNVSPESEFFLFDTDENGEPTTHTNEKGGFFDISPLDLGENARRDIVQSLSEMGFEMESSYHSNEKAQHCIDFKFDDCVQSADNYMTFKLAVRTVAKRHGLHATFMPKPNFGMKGSALFYNMFLCKNGVNVFSDPDEEYGLSKEAYYFMGGIMKHIKGMTLINNPIINSYKRLVPGYNAPVNISWSRKNRTPLMRITSSGAIGPRIVLRSPDGASNPYLVMAACLACGLEGIKNKIEPPVSQDDISPEEIAKLDFLPRTLMEAIREFEKDTFLQNVLGKSVSELFIARKSDEWSEFCQQVTAWEVEKYLNQI